MIKIRNKQALEARKRRLKKLVDDSLAKAKAGGYTLKRGLWAKHNEVDVGGAVCLVGAIGVTRAANPRNIVDLSDVNYLIRNGETEIVDDYVLWALSRGFEGYDYLYDTDRPPGPPGRLLNHYLNYAFKLGRRLGRGCQYYEA